MFNRRFTQIVADKDSDISPQRRREKARDRTSEVRDQLRESVFCLLGDDDKQKLCSIADDSRTRTLG